MTDDLFNQYSVLRDANYNISTKVESMPLIDFVKKYKSTDFDKLEDGSIINMPMNYPACNFDDEFLEYKENIPQGEEAMRVVVENTKTGVNIASPPGVKGTYRITRYGVPNTFDIDLIRYDAYEQMFEFEKNIRKGCPFDKHDCKGQHVKLVVPDYDGDCYPCENHRQTVFYIANINIAEYTNIKLFWSDENLLHLAIQPKTEDKIKLLKKIKIIMELAHKNYINKNLKLDECFQLRGIHYYEHRLNHHNRYGWALLYSNYRNRIAHIFLDELTDDIKVKEALVTIAYNIITAKINHDIDYIQGYFKNPTKKTFARLCDVHKSLFNLGIKYITNHKILC